MNKKIKFSTLSIENPRVGGSNPPPGTILFKNACPSLSIYGTIKNGSPFGGLFLMVLGSGEKRRFGEARSTQR